MIFVHVTNPIPFHIADKQSTKGKYKKMSKKESANKTSGKEMFALFTLIVLIGCILLI